MGLRSTPQRIKSQDRTSLVLQQLRLPGSQCRGPRVQSLVNELDPSVPKLRIPQTATRPSAAKYLNKKREREKDRQNR